MSDFKVGWWCVFKSADGSRRCLHFRNRESYDATCRVEANGRQILLWTDPAGPTGNGLLGRWESRFEFMPNAPAGDWWDNPNAAGSPRNPGDHSRNARRPTIRELAQRASAANIEAADGLNCQKEIHVGIFFDGTNNNRDRDRHLKGHSNVVSLWDAHKDDPTAIFRYYVPGVGTRFSEIGEEEEPNSWGNTFAAGGEARIHFGMLQVFNAVCRAAAGHDLLTAAEVKEMVTSTWQLHTVWRLGDSKMISIFRALDSRLRRATEGKRPKITKVNVSVIGFSRGSAQSRTFVNWFQLATGGTVGGASCVLRFLGVFDTVASVAVADSSPIGGSGFLDWADGTMGIAGVERTVHLVAAHEIRRSFPLSTARSRGTWPAGVREYVYPGAHSDIGGGYCPGDQGKATAGRTALLAQITLNDMYHEALNAAVKLVIKAELEPAVMNDFRVDQALDRAFMEYASWTIQYDAKQNVASVGGAPEDRMRYHTRLYWRWRAHVSADNIFKALSSYSNASAQDRIDLWEAELDWRRDVEAARQAAIPEYDYVPTMDGPIRSADKRSHASEVQNAILEQVYKASEVPIAVSDFFDRFVHDSHASFWMLGPRTRLDKKALIDEVKAKQRMHEYYTKLANENRNPGVRRNYRNSARYYELNQFERRVLAADASSPESVPVFTDADAPELKGRAGTITSVTMKLMGTATRREASGHGRYRRIFDES